MSAMRPFLMFRGGHDGEVLEVTRWQKGEQGAEDSIKLARLRAAGQSVQLNLA
jgi:hypothetical protein